MSNINNNNNNSTPSCEQLLDEISLLKQEIAARDKLEREYYAANQQLEASNQQLQATEQQLRATNQQLAASEKELTIEKSFSDNLIETANSFIVLLDAYANISLFNKYAVKLTGYTKKEVLGKNWFDIFIPENRQQAVFNPFEQADIEDKRAFEGSGLGLAITKAYVEMLGGKLWMTSVEGQGSTFTFTIPYATKEDNKSVRVTKPTKKHKQK